MDMEDTRKVYIINVKDENNSTYINSFRNIINAENEIWAYLDDRDYRGTENKEFKLLSLLNNILYNNILFYREILNKQDHDITFKTDKDLKLNYSDVLNINDLYTTDLAFSFIKAKSGLDVEIYLASITDNGGMYYGSVILITHPNYPFVMMYGIKRSILDVVTGGRIPLFRGISRLLINKIKEFAILNNKIAILIPNPLDPMIPILEHYGFQNIFDEESLEFKFIEKVIYGGDTNFVLYL